MNILRLSTLSLTLAVAVFALGYNTSFAGKKCDADPNHPSCKDDDPSANTHVAKLTGAFAFNTQGNSVDVTLNKKGNSLRSADSVTLIRPMDSTLKMIWNSVFEKCPDFFGPTPVNVPGFTAPADGKGWTIDKAGGVRVTFRKIPFVKKDFNGDLNPESVWVNLQLIGEIPFAEPFPPSVTIPLPRFAIWGQTESGVTPRLTCESGAVGEDFANREAIFLTITAK